MKKRLLSLLLAVVMLCLSAPLANASAAKLTAFRDVSNSDWYAGYVYALVKKGIVNGTSSTTYAPNQPLTRSQLIKMLAYATVDEETLAPYGKKKVFSDVKSSAWYAPSVNWAAEKKVALGYTNGKFGPDDQVTRAAAAAFVMRYARNMEGFELKTGKSTVKFTDEATFPAWAKDDILASEAAGIFTGNPDGSFGANDPITRAQAAAVLARLFSIQPLAESELPQQPVSPKIETIQRTVAGYSVNGVSFDAAAFRASIVLANDQFYNTESAASMVSRSGAVVACNGAFFNDKSDLTTHSAMIRDGKVLRTDPAFEPYKCYFVIDGNGKASMQFLSMHQTTQLYRNGEAISGAVYEGVGSNYKLSDTDGSRMIFTRAYGTKVPGKMKFAVICDESGKVTKVIRSKSGESIDIPKKGFVLCERNRRDANDEYKWEKLAEEVRVGDTIRVSVSYSNSSVKNIQMAFSCGPTVVKNGKAYGNSTTYAQEGYTEAGITTGSALRSCIGVKADGTVVIITTTASLSGLSQIMVALGCQTAMNLDGGSSTALYVNGSARVSAGRALTHMIVFTGK